MKKLSCAAVAVLLCAALAGAASARIKLVALPERAASIVRLDNPNFTLVEEERDLLLQKGGNQIDFSWKGVSIDADSIRLAVLNPKDVNLISVSYPPNEAALVWQLFTPNAATARCRISYLLSNIDRLVTYEGVAEKDESKIDMNSYVVLRNFSGEEFVNTKVQLDYGESFNKSVKNEETKRMLFLAKLGLPIEKTWKWDSAAKAWEPQKEQQNVGVPVYYTLYNTKAKGLGDNALWGGKARVYQKDGHGSTIFLGEDQEDLTPVGERMEIYIGDSRDIVVTQRWKTDTDINLKRDVYNNIVLYDKHQRLEALIENFKDAPAVLIVTQHIPGEWDMTECSHKYELKDAGTLEFRIELKPKEKVTLMMDYVRKNLRP